MNSLGYRWPVVSFVGAFFAIALGACAEDASPVSTPELIEAGQDQLVIAWEGQASEVEHWPIGKTDAVSLVSDQADTRSHEVEINGLQAGSHYSYRIRGTKETYNVQTEPLASSTISFVLFDGVSEEELLRHLVSNSPGFLVSLSPLPRTAFGSLRPFVPVYDPQGNTAEYLRRRPDFQEKSGYRIEWGPLVLVVSNDIAYLQKQVESLSSGYTLGLLTTLESADALDFEPLQRHQNASSTAPGFVLLIDSDRNKEVSGVRFVGVQAPHTQYNVLVDPEFASLTEMPSGIQTDLRPAPISSKRTCAECRKLAEKGAYRESVAAYLAFIKSNREHHLVDDAYFEVANIYDEKLFDFAQAIRWYKELVGTYPSSGLAPFARERLKYLTGFEARDLPALEEFEKIRRVSYGAADASTQGKLIEQVISKSEEKKDSALAPQMLYWAGNQLRQRDPQAAIAVFRALAATYPDSGRAADAVYAVAETLYESKEYGEARAAYVAALEVIPDRRDSILTQIERCDRNIRRFTFVWLAAVIVLGVLITSIAFRRSHRLRPWIKSAVVFLGMSLLLTTWAWTIREQFPRNNVLVALALGNALIAGLSSALVGPIAETMRNKTMRVVAAALLVSLFSISGMYLLVWITFEHYLTVFGL